MTSIHYNTIIRSYIMIRNYLQLTNNNNFLSIILHNNYLFAAINTSLHNTTYSITITFHIYSYFYYYQSIIKYLFLQITNSFLIELIHNTTTIIIIAIILYQWKLCSLLFNQLLCLKYTAFSSTYSSISITTK
jgi:hypothetical protein